MNLAQKVSEIEIRYIDPRMTKEQMDRAIQFVYNLHSRRPITKPIAIHLSNNGITVDEGEIAGLSPQEVADRFERKLQQGDESAMYLNQLLCEA